MTDTTCTKTGKVIYTRKAAQTEARRWRNRMFARMYSYRCKRCEGWHIGNVRRKPLQIGRRR